MNKICQIARCHKSGVVGDNGLDELPINFERVQKQKLLKINNFLDKL